TGDGSIVIQTLAGSLTINDGTASANNIGVNASGTGNVLLKAFGTTSDIVIDGDVLSGTGNVSVQAVRQVNFNSGADIRTGGTGTIDVEAGTGNVVMNDNSLFLAGSGDVRILAALSVTLGGV